MCRLHTKDPGRSAEVDSVRDLISNAADSAAPRQKSLL